ncbi:MAG: hypothetical protein HND52_07515 [Ignavibacteriae bacterium]|nr:hypothetical protein [Ignavibacteriota bacterium]NOG97793.1 hypothetical protein [Ignavibacteriota bacterium]
MIKKKKTYNINRFSTAALFLYFLLLANISFHHHVIDISQFSPGKVDTHSSSESNNQNEEFECSIIHFAQNSFQSLVIENSFDFQFQNSTLFSFESSNQYSSSLKFYKSLRAPPSNS